MKSKSKKKSISVVSLIALLAVLAGLFIVIRSRTVASEQASPAQTPDMTVNTNEAVDREESRIDEGPDDDIGRVVISEIMVKNKSALLCGELGFLDWIEIKNVSDTDVSLNDWAISDKQDNSGWTFPDGTSLASGEYLLVFAAGPEAPESGLYADFSLSKNDEVTLRTPRGNVSDSVKCADTKADVSYALNTDGRFAECMYPTPGRENDIGSYVSLQSADEISGPLIISEVDASNFSLMYDQERDDYPDWIELKNISNSAISLSGWTLTDDMTKPDKAVLPDVSLSAGGIMIIQCFSGESTYYNGNCIISGLKLNGENEQLYLLHDGKLSDYISIRDVSYGGSIGRMPGENGCFRFLQPSPGENNSDGFRYMCARPETEEPDGVFEGVAGVTVNLKGNGDIFYTLDGSMPTVESTRYTGPISLEETCVVRAICSDGMGINSRALTASYIINEGHSLPVLSVVGDDTFELERIYRQGQKGLELPGAIEFFDGDNSFSIDCGIRMAGRASLGRPQKNLSFKFRGRYGESRLEYPLYEEGFSSFSSLTLRSGHDSTKGVIRNELSEDLCLAATDKVAAQRSRWCVMYLDGQYYGLFALKDKINEDFFASLNGVDKESVEYDETPTYGSHEFFQTVIDFTIRSDMTVEDNYDQLCSILDIDSFIDWIIMEQYTGNFDILYGNTGFYRSAQLDNNRWKAVFYDLDAAFRYDYYSFRNFFNIDYKLNVYAQMLTSLFKNEEFRDKYLTRVGELLSTVLTNENVTAIINDMYALVDSEMPNECERWNQPLNVYESYKEELSSMIIGSDYESFAVETITNRLELTEAEVEHYFGRIPAIANK